MLIDILQCWGGGWFLANKFAYSRAERLTDEASKRRWRVWSWILYMVGLPAWFAIFVMDRNWMVMLVEMSGVPSLILGLLIALRGVGREPSWLSRTAYVSAALGLGLSLYDRSGFHEFGQALEIISVAGFLIGTPLIAKHRPSGYLWYLPMNGAMAALVALNGHWILCIQQVASLGFVLDAYLRARRPNIHPAGNS